MFDVRLLIEDLKSAKKKERLADRGEKKVLVCNEGVMREGRRNWLFTTRDTERDLERPWRAPFQFSLSNHLIPCFLDCILKNQSHNFHPICSLSPREHWQIVIFWPHSRRRVVRGRRADKRLLPFTPAHYWAFRPRSTNPQNPRRGRSCCFRTHPRSPAPWNLWLTTGAHSFSSKTIVYFKSLIYFIYHHVQLLKDHFKQTPVATI